MFKLLGNQFKIHAAHDESINPVMGPYTAVAMALKVSEGGVNGWATGKPILEKILNNLSALPKDQQESYNHAAQHYFAVKNSMLSPACAMNDECCKFKFICYYLCMHNCNHYM